MLQNLTALQGETPCYEDFLAISPDGNLFACNLSSGAIGLFNWDNPGQLIMRFPGHPGGTTCGAIYATDAGLRILTGGRDGTLYIHNPEKPYLPQVLGRAGGPAITCCAALQLLYRKLMLVSANAAEGTVLFIWDPAASTGPCRVLDLRSQGINFSLISEEHEEQQPLLKRLADQLIIDCCEIHQDLQGKIRIAAAYNYKAHNQLCYLCIWYPENNPISYVGLARDLLSRADKRITCCKIYVNASREVRVIWSLWKCNSLWETREIGNQLVIDKRFEFPVEVLPRKVTMQRNSAGCLRVLRGHAEGLHREELKHWPNNTSLVNVTEKKINPWRLHTVCQPQPGEYRLVFTQKTNQNKQVLYIQNPAGQPPVMYQLGPIENNYTNCIAVDKHAGRPQLLLVASTADKISLHTWNFAEPLATLQSSTITLPRRPESHIGYDAVAKISATASVIILCRTSSDDNKKSFISVLNLERPELPVQQIHQLDFTVSCCATYFDSTGRTFIICGDEKGELMIGEYRAESLVNIQKTRHFQHPEFYSPAHVDRIKYCAAFEANHRLYIVARSDQGTMCIWDTTQIARGPVWFFWQRVSVCTVLTLKEQFYLALAIENKSEVWLFDLSSSTIIVSFIAPLPPEGFFFLPDPSDAHTVYLMTVLRNGYAYPYRLPAPHQLPLLMPPPPVLQPRT